MSDNFEKRKRKAEKIIELYKQRSYRQEDVSKELGIPIGVVEKVTKAYGFAHGKKKSVTNPNNLISGQAVNPVIMYGDMDFLDKYDF